MKENFNNYQNNDNEEENEIFEEGNSNDLIQYPEENDMNQVNYNNIYSRNQNLISPQLNLMNQNNEVSENQNDFYDSNLTQNTSPNLMINMNPNTISNINTMTNPNIIQNMNPTINQNLLSNINPMINSNIIQNMNNMTNPNLLSNINPMNNSNIISNINPMANKNLIQNMNNMTNPNLISNINQNPTQYINKNIIMNKKKINSEQNSNINLNNTQNINTNYIPNYYQNYIPNNNHNNIPNNIQNINSYNSSNLYQNNIPNTNMFNTYLANNDFSGLLYLLINVFNKQNLLYEYNNNYRYNNNYNNIPFKYQNLNNKKQFNNINNKKQFNNINNNYSNINKKKQNYNIQNKKNDNENINNYQDNQNNIIEKDNKFIKEDLFNFNKIKEIKDLKNIIINKAKEKNYNLTEDDKKILDVNDYDKDKNVFYNEYMFYSKERISIYNPHIIKEKNNIISILLPENEKQLNLSDFQYSEKYKKITNDIFLEILERRINQYNNLNKNEYNEKIFGFNSNIKKSNYYLYSTIDDDLIEKKIKENNFIKLKNGLLGNKSQINEDINSRISSISKFYFKENTDYLNGLTYEELILYIIIERLNNQYETLPKILFYEQLMAINGQKDIFLNDQLSGYNEIDYVIYSKCDCKYKEDNPLIIQRWYNYDTTKNNVDFEIKKDTLYLFELKSSSYYINDDFFKKIFNKCKEFVNLYESKKWITKDTQKEIMLIYDDKIDYKIEGQYEYLIQKFLKDNKDYSFNIVYSIKTYPYFSHSLAIKNQKKIEEKYEKVSNEIKEMTDKNKEMNDKNIQLSKEIKEMNDKNIQLSNEIKEMKSILTEIYSKIDLDKFKNNNENEKSLKDRIDDLNKKISTETDKKEN